MLASTCLPRRSWPNTGVPAFVPSPSLHAQDEPPRTTLSTWSSILYASGTESQHVNLLRSSRKRPRELSTVVGGGDASMTYRKISLSCLRGGSDSAGDDAPNAQSDEEDTSSSSNTAGLPPTATHTTTSSDQIKRQQQQEEVSKPFQRQQQGTHPPAAFGVSLVTERSTATGSSKGRVSYSVLADGTLQVGSHKRPTAATSSLQPSAPASAVRTTTPPLPRTAIAHPTPGRTPRNGPRKFLQGLGRCSQDLKTRVGQAMKGGVDEAKAVAVGAGACAAKAGVAMRGGLMNTFLPAGYPGSVRPEYLRYRCWDIIQDLSSHLRGVLATQAVLEGMGVGRAGSTPLAATLQWMARDGASMIGGLLFTSVASANFGVNIKTWRLFADASNDVGLALEMLAPLPAFREGGRFLRLICVASVFKAACGVAGGATGAAITEHWAVDNNIADIGAKNGAQHTVASLLGLGLSVWFARAVSDAGSASGTRVWGWYLALTVVHLLANYVAMRTLALRSLNPSRASLLVTEYLRQSLGPEGSQGADDAEEEGGVEETGPDWMGRTDGEAISAPQVLSPSRAASLEKILMLPGWVRSLKPWGDILQIKVGVPVRSLVGEADDLLWLTSLYHDEKAMVEVQVSYQPLGPRMGTKVNLALREDASADDRLQAMFQANVIHHLLAGDPDSIPQGGDPVDRTLFLRKVTEEALRVTRKEFPYFRKALVREGWDLSRVTLGGGPWVGRWGSLSKED